MKITSQNTNTITSERKRESRRTKAGEFEFYTQFYFMVTKFLFFFRSKLKEEIDLGFMVV